MGDISKMPDESNTFARVNKEGLIEIVSEETGEVILIQKSYRDLLREKNENLVQMTLPDGRIILYEKGVNLARTGLINSYKFDEVMAGIVCQRIAEGAKLTRLHEEGLPSYATICKWRALYPEFAKMMEIAINDRGHVFADKAIAVAESTKTKDDAVVHRTQIDTYKWVAERSSPDQYGNKVQHRGDKSAPLQLIVDTGVPAPDDRVADSNVIEIEGRDVGAAPATEDS